MASEIKIPSVGESVSEVTIGKWLKHEGDHVARDEIVLALETDKVNVEVPAPEAGTLKGLTKKEGETARIGDVVATIVASGAPSQQSAPQPKVEPAHGQNLGKNAQGRRGPDAGHGDVPTTAQDQEKSEAHAELPVRGETSKPQANDVGDDKVMPAAQRLLHESGLKAQDVPRTGPSDRLLKEDVMRKLGEAKKSELPPSSPAPSVASPSGPPPEHDGALEKVVPMSTLRRRIAERLVQAQQTAAILTTFNEVDMYEVMTLRKNVQEQFLARYGIKLGFMSFFVKAAIDALRLVPEINAEIRGNDIIYKNHYDIGVAVGGDKGLVVPVIKRSELLSFAEVEKVIYDFGGRAKSNKLKLEELSGGTFTISNGGTYGSLLSTPIINPPQSGILGMHNIIERPVALNGQIVIRPMMYIALSYDHRVVDGKGAVTFLKRVKECIEAPQRLLLEV